MYTERAMGVNAVARLAANVLRDGIYWVILFASDKVGNCLSGRVCSL